MDKVEQDGEGLEKLLLLPPPFHPLNPVKPSASILFKMLWAKFEFEDNTVVSNKLTVEVEFLDYYFMCQTYYKLHFWWYFSTLVFVIFCVF